MDARDERDFGTSPFVQRAARAKRTKNLTVAWKRRSGSVWPRKAGWLSPTVCDLYAGLPRVIALTATTIF